MKKRMNNIKNFFSHLGRIIDKKIIIPITKFFVMIKDYIGSDNKRFEKFINKKSSLLFVTLVLALAVFFVVDSKSIAMLETSAEVLYNQDVNVIYNEEAYVLEGVPSHVDITLIGRKSDLYLAKQIPDHEITLDLTGLKPGIHKVALKYKRALTSINYKLDPSIATVTIYPKVSESRTVTVDLLNKDKLDSKLVIQKNEIDRDEVIVKGSADKIKQVATVKALIDVNNFVTPSVGVLELKDIPLIAYNQNGNVVNVEIVPAKVNANITITSPSKTVPIKVIPTGTITFGKAISSINTNINEVTIYGDDAILADIANIPVEIDVNGLKANKEYNITLDKPSGIRSMGVGIVNVNVVIENEDTKDFEGIKIEPRNLGSNYAVQAKSQSDMAITVAVKGVQSILSGLDPNTISAYVDLTGYGPGEHEVDVYVEKSDVRLTYVPKVKKVTVIITNKK